MPKEEYKNQKKQLEGNGWKNKNYQRGIAHHNFLIDESGYEFKNDNGIVKFTYNEFTEFLHKIENEFYSDNLISKG